MATAEIPPSGTSDDADACMFAVLQAKFEDPHRRQALNAGIYKRELAIKFSQKTLLEVAARLSAQSEDCTKRAMILLLNTQAPAIPSVPGSQ